MHRLFTNQFPDDHSVYHHEEGEGVHVDEDAASLHKTETERRQRRHSSDSDHDDSASEDGEITEKEEEEAEDPEKEQIPIKEIRDGIPDERDVEAGPSPLEKKKSSRSIKDPNLVCFVSNFLWSRDTTDTIA